MTYPIADDPFFDVTDIDSAWLSFLQEVDSLSRWDCLRYFLEVSDEPATLDQIALAAGRDSATLLDDLGALTSAGWLSRRRIADDATVYQLTQSDEWRQRLDDFYSAMQETPFRLRVLYQWTRGQMLGDASLGF